MSAVNFIFPGVNVKFYERSGEIAPLMLNEK